MKKLRTLCLAVGLTLSLATCALAQWETWAEPARDYVTEHGIMEDTEPQGVATRAQLAVALNNLLGCDLQADLSQFPDVNPDAWYYDAMGTAVQLGVFQGSDGKLLEASLTHLDAMVALGRVFGYWEYTTQPMKHSPIAMICLSGPGMQSLPW